MRIALAVANHPLAFGRRVPLVELDGAEAVGPANLHLSATVHLT